ncbi:hypothetical protein R3P38DRAFT_2762803 [Favolaschia claudopus]|uniref:Uncharacterized protein n=1 Tax=Favolaschia claudopus TaxID=2862362 RepID=A0AAW0DN80_9AGAR
MRYIYSSILHVQIFAQSVGPSEDSRSETQTLCLNNVGWTMTATQYEFCPSAEIMSALPCGACLIGNQEPRMSFDRDCQWSLERLSSSGTQVGDILSDQPLGKRAIVGRLWHRGWDGLTPIEGVLLLCYANFEASHRTHGQVRRDVKDGKEPSFPSCRLQEGIAMRTHEIRPRLNYDTTLFEAAPNTAQTCPPPLKSTALRIKSRNIPMISSRLHENRAGTLAHSATNIQAIEGNPTWTRQQESYERRPMGVHRRLNRAQRLSNEQLCAPGPGARQSGIDGQASLSANQLNGTRRV